MIYIMSIKHAKFSYSSIKSQLFPCAAACGCKFHALAIYLHPTFTSPFQSEAHLESSQTAAVEFFAETVSTFAIIAAKLHRGCLTGF